MRAIDDRGRLTLPFLMQILGALAFLGALYPVFAEAFAEHGPALDPGARLMWQLILPLGLLVLLTVIFVKAGVG